MLIARKYWFTIIGFVLVIAMILYSNYSKIDTEQMIKLLRQNQAVMKKQIAPLVDFYKNPKRLCTNACPDICR